MYYEGAMTSVRLPAELEEKLEMLSLSKHKTKSEIIKEALELLLDTENQKKDSYALGREYFGRYGSGGSSESYKDRVKEKIRAKHNSR
jgi:Arc/MetJ-type ribon-helix-helix transcriptional regulator